MKVTRFELNPFGENTYILWNEASHNAIFIDPGMMNEREEEMIKSFVDENQLQPELVILTHVHIDHVTGVDWCVKQYGCTVMAHKDDKMNFTILPLQVKLFGLKIATPNFKIDEYLTDGQVIDVLGEELKVIHTPGHSKGSITLYAPESAIAVTGDTLFQNSIGRTDLPGGDYQTIIASIKHLIDILPSDTVVVAGHGLTTTIGEEARSNPFLN